LWAKLTALRVPCGDHVTPSTRKKLAQRAIINSKYIINIILEQMFLEMPNNNKKLFTAKPEITLTTLKVLYAKKEKVDLTVLN
jgi:hypothetical protein